MLGFALCVQFIADIAPAALAAELVDVMRGARQRPLVRIDLRPADVAHLRLCQLHLLFGARRMLLFGEMVLAESPVAIGAVAERLFIALVTTRSFGHYLAICPGLSGLLRDISHAGAPSLCSS